MFCKSAVSLRCRLPIRSIAFGLYLASLDFLRLVYFFPLFSHFSKFLEVSFGLVHGLDPLFFGDQAAQLAQPHGRLHRCARLTAGHGLVQCSP